DDAWTEFTRWNAFTGTHAAGGPYASAGTWPEAPREPAIAASGKLYIEGLSARYAPIVAANRAQVAVTPTAGIHVAAWIVADGRGLSDGIGLDPDGAALTATARARSYTL